MLDQGGHGIKRDVLIHELTEVGIECRNAALFPIEAILGKLSALPQLAMFKDKCPLWTYILAEAANNRTSLNIPVTPATTISTPQLGPVGGRIVAEVSLGMLFGDNDSFLSSEPDWTPSIRGKGANFALRDIVAYALGQ